MIGWLLCRFKGHLRGKEIIRRELFDGRMEITYACPRCGKRHVRRRKS